MRRRDLNPGQRAMITLDIEPALEAAAKERQRKAGGDRKSLKSNKKSEERLGPIGPKRSPSVREQVAAKAKVGQGTVSRAKKVKNASGRR